MISGSGVNTSVDVAGTTASKAENGRGDECERPLCFKTARRSGMMEVSSARMGTGGGGREMIALASTDFGLVYHCLVGAFPGAAWTVGTATSAEEVAEDLGVAGRVLLSSPFRPNINFRANVLGDRVAFGLTLTVVEDVVECIERLESDLVRERAGFSSTVLFNELSTTAGELGGDVEATEIGEDISGRTSLPELYESAPPNDDDEPGMYVGSKCIHTSSSSSWDGPKASGGSVGGNSRPLPFPEPSLVKEDGEVPSIGPIDDNTSENDGGLKGW